MKKKSNYLYYVFLFGFSVTLYSLYEYIEDSYPLFYFFYVLFFFSAYNVILYVLGFYAIWEFVDNFYYNRQLRTLELQYRKVKINKLDADKELTKAKINSSSSPLERDGVLPIKRVERVPVVDLSSIIAKPILKPLISTIETYQRILVVGGQGSGKTSIMLWLAQAKQKMGNVLVIDTHASPIKWPNNVCVLGLGRSYDKAEQGFQQLLWLMNKRYNDIGKGLQEERSHKIITVLSDEWTMLPKMIPNFSENYVKPIFTESRKASIDLSLAVHDITVGALGMQGMSGLKQSFDVIVWCERIKGDFQTIISYGFGKNALKEECLPPGPYVRGGTPLLSAETYIDLKDINGVRINDVPILEAMRKVYNNNVNVVDKGKLRKELGLQANKSSYTILEDVASRYNIMMV